MIAVNSDYIVELQRVAWSPTYQQTEPVHRTHNGLLVQLRAIVTRGQRDKYGNELTRPMVGTSKPGDCYTQWEHSLRLPQ